MKWISFIFLVLLIACSPSIHKVEGLNIEKNGLVIPDCFENYCASEIPVDLFCQTDTYKYYYGRCRGLDQWDDLTFPGAKTLRIEEPCGTIIKVYNESGSEYYSYYFYDKDSKLLIGIMIIDDTNECNQTLYGESLKCCY